MDKKVELSILLDIYGNMLTEKQSKLLDDYYNNDLSLSEIAENNEITRQAVRDNLKKGENNLLEFEEKLGIMKQEMNKEKVIENVLKEIDTITANKDSFDSKEILKLKKIKDKLNSLI